ncbi:MAG: adenosylmethionine--8-amino-7-oxononanoate transaminase [Puniceicoccales bacterium]|jgi:adenosylmethionine-8-amino-7-oxononanoate aminotransferase|nr:adenosylmethionine--8-amino-7-oxononanoate transaminase [Puniceicoccales bacterium]
MKIWHPFTQEKTADAPLKIIRGEGVYLFDERRKRYLDMISSWWTNLLGHAHGEIAEAIYWQASTLEHLIFAGFTHDPAEQLCQNLSKFLPKTLEYFFFSDDGSTAVEVAIKMAYQYFANLNNENRNIYINLAGGYHGDTLGAMSAAGNHSAYHGTFSEFFFETFSIDFPQSPEDEVAALEKLEKFLKQNSERVCALILEPLVQGAAGMKMYRAEFLDRVVREVRRYGIPTIFDEVMTGFYRTGTMFAMDQCAEKPDIVCLSKGITGGFLPLALTVVSREIYGAFLSDDCKKAFIHGHSYTANPLACAAAIKTMEILQRQEIQQNIRTISEIHRKSLQSLDNVSQKRDRGTIAAFAVESVEKAKAITKNMFQEGIIIRPIGQNIYLLPPYCTTAENLEYVYEKLKQYL